MDINSNLINMNFIIAGGGTGGHLFPALAIGEKLAKMGANVTYFGSKFGIESAILKQKKVNHFLLNIRGIQRGFDLKSIGKNLLFPFRFCFSLLSAMYIIKRTNPKIIIGTGGYSSGIPLFCAQILGIPMVLHEQNSFPGITTRFFAKKAKVVCIASEESKKYIKSSKLEFTGNPIRGNIKKLDAKIARKKMKLNEDKFTLFFMGGSQGSKPINEHLFENYKNYINQNCQIIWQCGKLSYKNLNKSIQHPDIHIIDFIDEMDVAYSSASLVVCRSGAISLAELTACGKAMILIPFPQAAGNHQVFNAKELESKNAAKVVLQNELQHGKLEEIVMDLKNNPKKIIELENNSSACAIENATEQIINQIIGIAA